MRRAPADRGGLGYGRSSALPDGHQPAVVRAAETLASAGRLLRWIAYLVMLVAITLAGILIDLGIEVLLEELPPTASTIVAVVVFGPIAAAMVAAIVYIEVVRRRRIRILP